jgi:hypothetical protein
MLQNLITEERSQIEAAQQRAEARADESARQMKSQFEEQLRVGIADERRRIEDGVREQERQRSEDGCAR